MNNEQKTHNNSNNSNNEPISKGSDHNDPALSQDDTYSIHEFEFQMIRDFFSTMDRQGPGSPEMTRKALGFVGEQCKKGRIADIGCGTGGQTMILAQDVPGTITGIDIFPEFIELFNQNAGALGLQDRVKGIPGSMDDLPFEPESLDLIWSEGAIFIMGFENGLKYWEKFLKPGGYIAVTDACWFTPERPKEIHDFWMEAYPSIDTISNNVTRMEQAGFIPEAVFILPENCWTEHFYDKHPKAAELFLQKHAGIKKAEEFVAYQQLEIDLYQKYKEYYGYVFFVGKKRE